MNRKRTGRRDFLTSTIGTAAGIAVTTARGSSARTTQEPSPTPRAPRIRFAAIGLNHNHIFGQVESVLRGGGELVSFFAKEDDLAEAFAKRHPAARRARS